MRAFIFGDKLKWEVFIGHGVSSCSASGDCRVQGLWRMVELYIKYSFFVRKIFVLNINILYLESGIVVRSSGVFVWLGFGLACH